MASPLVFSNQFDEFHPSALNKYKQIPSPMIRGKLVTEPKEGTKLYEAIEALEKGNFQETIQICGTILSIFEARDKYSAQELCDARLIENSAHYYKCIFDNSIIYLDSGIFDSASWLLSRLSAVFPKSKKICQFKYKASAYEQSLMAAHYAYHEKHDTKVAAQKAKEILDEYPKHPAAQTIYYKCSHLSLYLRP